MARRTRDYLLRPSAADQIGSLRCVSARRPLSLLTKDITRPLDRSLAFPIPATALSAQPWSQPPFEREHPGSTLYKQIVLERHSARGGQDK